MRAQVVDRQPPRTVLQVVNPVLRTLLTGPAGRLLPGLAVLQFTGRRTGRAYRVVTGWYALDGQEFAVTPAAWRANFAGGAPLTVTQRGQRRIGVGSLDTDRAAVADALRRLISTGTSPTALGMRVPPEYEVGEGDTLGKALVRFTPA